MKLLLICILRVLLSQYFFISVYVVLFLFNNVIYVFLLYDCMFMYDYPDWGFSRAFSSVVRQMPGWYPKRRGTARTLPNFFVALCIFCVVLCIFCCFVVVLCTVCFVTFPVLFVCICVLNNCHWVATQLQLNINIYHIIYHTYKIAFKIYVSIAVLCCISSCSVCCLSVTKISGQSFCSTSKGQCSPITWTADPWKWD
jgi:hypothetical protein